jgi:hypothetical protein
MPTGHTASLEIDGLIITSHVVTAIKEASYRRKFIEYISQRAGWQDKETYHTIDWGHNPGQENNYHLAKA